MPADPCLRLLRELVAIDSVNPSLVPGAAGEGAIAQAIAAYLRRIGLDVRIEDVVPGRPNVIGVLEGREPGPTMLFCGHMDTVGVEGMDAPFDPVERGGRLFGRGAQDMKGGLAAMMDAARCLAASGLPRGRLVIAAVVDEEFESLGADHLVGRWPADVAVVTEPTDLCVGIAHKGFAWIAIETRGIAAHGSRPREGRDAIFRMGRVLCRLEALDRELQSRDAHPLMGTGSIHASTVAGGREWSSYPDRCSLTVERRTLSRESAGQALREIEAILRELREDDPELAADARLVFAREAYEIAAGHPLPTQLQSAVRALGPPGDLVGMSFWTDAAVLGAAGIPAVLFGPGGAGLHGREEYVSIADVLTCRDALVRLAGDLGWGAA